MPCVLSSKTGSRVLTVSSVWPTCVMRAWASPIRLSVLPMTASVLPMTRVTAWPTVPTCWLPVCSRVLSEAVV